MSKQLNIFYEFQREKLYKGIKEAQIIKNAAFERSKCNMEPFTIKKFLQWLKNNPGVNPDEYKEQLIISAILKKT